MTRKTIIAALALSFVAAPAWGLGTFIGPDGATINLEASRTLFVKTAENIRIITQVRYAGTPEKLLWILAIPNFNNPGDDGVLVETAPQTALDALATLTWPRFEGVCDDVPNGQLDEAPQRDGWGPAPNMALPQRIFSVPAILAEGRLAQYANDLDLTIDEATQAVIDEATDQNFMFVTLRIDTAELGVNRIDPIVSITYPQSGNARIALHPTNSATLQGNADLVWWTLGNERMRSNLTTQEISPEKLEFISQVDTNYLPVFDETVAERQTQMFITEYASGVDGAFAEASLEALRGDATFLTRMRARLSPPALRANAFVTLRGDGSAAYDNNIQVKGFMCPGDMPMDPDMGVDAGTDMGVDPAADMGMEAGDMGVDPGTDAEVVGGGDGGGDGCSTAPHGPSSAWLLLGLLWLPWRRRR